MFAAGYGAASSVLDMSFSRRSQRDSNPCLHLERWSAPQPLTWGDGRALFSATRVRGTQEFAYRVLALSISGRPRRHRGDLALGLLRGAPLLDANPGFAMAFYISMGFCTVRHEDRQ